MRDMRSNRDNVPDFDRFGFRPLSSPTNFPQLEHRNHRNTSSSRPFSPASAASSEATAASSAPQIPRRSTPDQDNSAFLQDALQVHNDFRRRHRVEPLRLNNDLCKLAQQWGKSNFSVRIDFFSFLSSF